MCCVMPPCVAPVLVGKCMLDNYVRFTYLQQLTASHRFDVCVPLVMELCGVCGSLCGVCVEVVWSLMYVCPL